MGSRLDLHAHLLTLCDNVYFQPPSSKSLEYPCIVYRNSGSRSIYADNLVYTTDPMYDLTVIDRDPDSALPENVLKSIPMCKVVTTYTASNIHHTVLTLYY